MHLHPTPTPLNPLLGLLRAVCVLAGVDTGVVDKDSRPGFMQHFDKKEEQNKRGVGRKAPPQGPHDISYYFPDIPEGMDFREFVSNYTCPHTSLKYGCNLVRRA